MRRVVLLTFVQMSVNPSAEIRSETDQLALELLVLDSSAHLSKSSWVIRHVARRGLVVCSGR